MLFEEIHISTVLLEHGSMIYIKTENSHTLFDPDFIYPTNILI